MMNEKIKNNAKTLLGVIVMLAVICMALYMIAPTQVRAIYNGIFGIDSEMSVNEDMTLIGTMVAGTNADDPTNPWVYPLNYDVYKDYFPQTESKYIWVEGTEPYYEPGTIDATVELKFYEVNEKTFKKGLKSITARHDELNPESSSASDYFPTDFNLIESNFEDTIENMTKGPGGDKYTVYENIPIGCFDGKIFGGNRVTTKQVKQKFTDYGLDLDCNNVEVTKLVGFSHGRVVAFVNADVTTIKCEGEASALSWVPAVGETKNITFFVDIYPSFGYGWRYQLYNIEIA